MAEATAILRKTALNATHRAHKALMVDFGGWDMPVLGQQRQPMGQRPDVRVLDGFRHIVELKRRGVDHACGHA